MTNRQSSIDNHQSPEGGHNLQSPVSETPASILIVDDDQAILRSIQTILLGAGMPAPTLISDSRQVMERVRRSDYQLVLMDLMMPHIGGIELLRQVKREFPQIECIVITALDDVKTAVQAMQYGAYDYLTKPFESERLIITINRALERYSLRHGLAPVETALRSFDDLKHAEAFGPMVARDEKMAQVFHRAEVVAATDYNLFISGETGTGKEMLARIIHRISRRSARRFVGVNVAASSKTLFEDDFFGHTREAYTGARQDKKGYFEMAHGGTLFLDEITEMDPQLQVKLLRVIQEREVYRLGGNIARDIDVRILSATNRNVDDLIRDGLLRQDLFYRLNMFHIGIPPLRDRRKDIPALARHFLKVHCAKLQKNIDTLSPELTDRLLAYAFPGNVREMENIIAAGVLNESGNTLTLSAVRELVPAGHAKAGAQPDEALLPLDEIEKRHILNVLEATDGNRTRTAEILEIGLRTLQRKLKAYRQKMNSKTGFGKNTSI